MGSNLRLNTIYIFFTFFFLSCKESSDVIVKIYGTFEYNCTKNEYRILAENPILPFLKKNKWYTKNEFHNSHVKHTLKPWKNLPMSEDTIAKIRPKKEESYYLLDEFVKDVDCENPADVLF